MSEFYGRLQGHRGEATRCGSKSVGIYSSCNSWYTKTVIDYCGRDIHEGDNISIDVNGYNGPTDQKTNINLKIDTTDLKNVNLTINNIEIPIKEIETLKPYVEVLKVTG